MCLSFYVQKYTKELQIYLKNITFKTNQNSCLHDTREHNLFRFKKTENMYNCKYMFEFTYLAKNLLKWKSVSIEDEEDSTPYLISLHNLQSKSC